MKRAVCVSRLPPEPEAGDPQAIHVMLRTPGGERLERRFSASDKLQVSISGPAATVRSVRPWPYQFLREKNGVAWILTWLAL